MFICRPARHAELTGWLFWALRNRRTSLIFSTRSDYASHRNTFRVTPDETVAGHITSVNKRPSICHLLTFPLGHARHLVSRMNVFRNGVIVGEIKITGPQR